MNWGGPNQPGSSKTAAASPQTTHFSSPTHQYASSAAPSPRAPSTPIHQTRSPSEPSQPLRPDYNRAHFDQNNPNPKSKPGGGDIFADILGQQGYNFASKGSGGPRTINAMRKEELVRDMDPEKLRMLEWVF